MKQIHFKIAMWRQNTGSLLDLCPIFMPDRFIGLYLVCSQKRTNKQKTVSSKNDYTQKTELAQDPFKNDLDIWKQNIKK